MSANFCRTCEHWNVLPGAVGVGSCGNFDVHIRMFGGLPNGMRTTQDFGCVFHKQGRTETPLINAEAELLVATDFMQTRFT